MKIFTLVLLVSVAINSFAFSVEKHKSKGGMFRGVCNDGYVFMDSWHVYKDVVLNGMKDCKDHGGFTAPPAPKDVPRDEPSSPIRNQIKSQMGTINSNLRNE